ncbi:putative reverse transcriptase domain-containing protein, partial [Tanacetum coccineum]
LEEDLGEDPKEDPTDYPVDGGDDDDDDDESSDDDNDDDDFDEDNDEEEEEEHPAPTDSFPPPPVHRTTARISIPAQAPVPFLSEEEAKRFLAIPTPPPSLLTPLSSPLPQIYLHHCHSSAPRPTRGFRTDYGFVAYLDAEIRRDPERDVGYGITNTWDEILVGMLGAPATDDTELGRRMIEFSTMVRQDTYEIYGRLDEAHDARAVLSGRLNLLQRDRCSHAYTTLLTEREARLSCRDCSLVSSRLRSTGTACRDTETDEYTADTENGTKKSHTRSTPATTTTTTSVTNAQLKALIDQGVAGALAACDANRSMNGDDSHNSGMGVRRQASPARKFTYPDFMKCKTQYFKGTKGVIELTQWFERIETVFRISNCTVENQIKFATCTLLVSALTWWNSHVKTIGHDVAHAVTWTNLKKKMTNKYCPRGEIKKLKVEMWNLKVKGTDVVSYNQRFQELALMCARMFPEESDKIEKYVGSLPNMIHGSVMAFKPKTMQDAIEFATELMDKKIGTFAE